MKHLFILNPLAVGMKNRVDSVISEISAFFDIHMDFDYTIHVTRWARDATGYARSFAQEAGDTVRIHSYGGAGLLSEIINGVIGLPNVQIAAYPMGGCNDFIRYFRAENTHLFASIEKQIFSGVVPMDVIRCGSYYGISYGMIGVEAKADRASSEMIDRTGLPSDFCILWKAVECILSIKNQGQQYKITLDGAPMDGKYISILIANAPCYGKDMNPAIEAHPNDGRLDIYVMKSMPRLLTLTGLPSYLAGNYYKTPSRYVHWSGKKIAFSSDEIMYGSVDGETFLERHAEFEIVPGAISLVCPDEIDVGRLPRIYTKPEEGCANDR